MKPSGTMILSVDKRSPAERVGITAGEYLVAVNGQAVQDVLQVQFYAYDAQVVLTISSEIGQREVAITKREGEDLGLNFTDELFDGIHTCTNKCIFCFIDQNPPGLRETIYCRDDDTRLSLLTGSYITLTNLKERDIDRLIDMRISPIHISVHTTDPELRCVMLNNRFAGQALQALKRLADAGLALHGQIVVCAGYNDGEQLTRTLQDLQQYSFISISVVPAGLTAHRQGLPELRPIDGDNARDIIKRCQPFANVYCADELYLTAQLPLPSEAEYDGYPQLDNGVGLLTSLRSDFLYELEDIDLSRPIEPFTLITGVAAAPLLQELIDKLPQANGRVVAIENRFFGSSVTVAGLVTGGDIMTQLRGTSHHRLLIPSVMLRHEGDLFLDNTTPQQIAEAMHCTVQIVPIDAAHLLQAIQNPSTFAVERM